VQGANAEEPEKLNVFLMPLVNPALYVSRCVLARCSSPFAHA
jgi:hypothetical protein